MRFLIILYMRYKTPKEQRRELIRTLRDLFLGIAILLFLGTLVYKFAEGWPWLDALYFATISLTSRGYTNLYPTSAVSILFSVFYLIAGVGLIIYAISTLIAFYTTHYRQSISKKVDHFVKGFKKKPEPRPLKKVIWRPKRKRPY